MLQGVECKEMDLRGQICPSTLLTVLREVNSLKSELKSGQVNLLFLSDNRSSTTHISDSVGAMGYTVDIVKDHDHGCYRICIFKKIS